MTDWDQLSSLALSTEVLCALDGREVDEAVDKVVFRVKIRKIVKERQTVRGGSESEVGRMGV